MNGCDHMRKEGWKSESTHKLPVHCVEWSGLSNVCLKLLWKFLYYVFLELWIVKSRGRITRTRTHCIPLLTYQPKTTTLPCVLVQVGIRDWYAIIPYANWHSWHHHITPIHTLFNGTQGVNVHKHFGTLWPLHTLSSYDNSTKNA